MAEQYLVNHADMVSVADAIRGKAGVEDDLTFPAGFVGAVEGIQAGGGGDIDALIDGSITEIDNSTVLTVKNHLFQLCTHLESAKFQNATVIGESSFEYCTALANVELPSVTTIKPTSFRNCTTIRCVELPSVTSFGTSCFNGCRSLKTVILRAGAVATLGNNAFMGTPIANGQGYIYVPSALIDTYKAASGWSIYAAQFRALEDYTVDGTITGELDESKI